MEEDIKALRDYLDSGDQYDDYHFSHGYGEHLENLIKGYRELEGKIERQELSFVNGYMEGGRNQLNVMTSKIKEKIEELELKDNSDFLSMGSVQNLAKIHVLEELLDEEKGKYYKMPKDEKHHFIISERNYGKNQFKIDRVKKYISNWIEGAEKDWCSDINDFIGISGLYRILEMLEEE